LVVTCEFDPLSDEGTAYAEAMKEAGISVTHLAAPGQVHTSLTAVDMVISGAPVREEMGVALRKFFGVSVPA
jgi:acetyl esterase/lipase